MTHASRRTRSRRTRPDARHAGPVPFASRRTWQFAFTLLVVLTVGALTVALAAAAPTGPDALVPDAVAASAYGGTCGSSCDDGGSSGGSSSNDPDPVGRSYWVTTNQVLSSYDPGTERLVQYHANRTNGPIDYSFSLSERTVRSVDFSGGYADYVRISVGGETDTTRTTSVSMVIEPWEALKVYQRFETRRYTVYGTRYQDYDDGSRSVVGRSSGPYTSSVTKTGYVTNALR